MAGKVRNDDMSSLPPNYVSLAQLRDIWMKKKEEQKLKEKEEEERKQAAEKRKQEEELRKQEEEKRKQEEELRKQEEEKRKQEKEKRNDGRRKTGSGYARIVLRERVSKMALIDEKGKGAEELRKHEEKRNDGRRIMGSGYERIAARIDEKGKGKELTIGGYGVVEEYKKWNNSHFREMESAGDERNRNEVEKEKIRVEKRVNNGTEMVPINGVMGGIPNEERMKIRGGFRKNRENRGPNGRSRNEHGDRLNQVKQNEGTSDFRAGMLDDKGYNEKKGERGRNNGGYLNKDNRLKESRVAVLKGKGVEPDMVKKGEDEIVEVLGESSGLRGRRRNGYKGRNGKDRGRYNKFKESRDAVLKLETEKKAEDAILEGFNEKCCLNKGDRHDEEKRKETNENRAEGEGSNDDRVAVEGKVGDGILTVDMESKVDDGVLMVGNVKNGEEGAQNEHRRHENWRRHFGERRYTRVGRYNDRQRIKRGSGMMWVKKEVKSTADSGTSGVPYIESN